jgi:hypothetical protein
MAFLTPVSVANRTAQHLGEPRITLFTDSSKFAKEAGFAIDMVRRSELRRSVWTFATRRAVLRPTSATSKLVTFDTYSAAQAYTAGDIVQTSDGYLWLCIVAATGTTPGAGGIAPPWVPYYGSVMAHDWDAAVAYLPGDLVFETTVFSICILANTNQNPPNATYWHVIADATGAVPAVLAPTQYNTPAGASTRNVYRLPANFVRVAPQNPKAAAITRPNTTAGMHFNDWEIEGQNLLTDDTSPILFRFGTDIQDVTSMPDLFCETWAARLALDLCETVTQSQQKKADMLALYNECLDMAAFTNAIEGGSSEDPRPRSAQQAPQAGRGG